jgi:hypothetical protein
MKDELSQVVREYQKFRESGRPSPRSTYRLPDGSIMELCHTNGHDWTLCVVRAGDGALTPVAIGDNIDMVMSRYGEILPEWQPALWPPLTVVVDGATRVFVPAGMSLLLGVVEFGRGALLIGVIKRAGKSGLALLHVGVARISVLHFGNPMDLRAVDIDGLLELQDGAVQAPSRELDPALLGALARLLARVLKPRKRCLRRRGTGSSHLFMWVIVQLVLMGADDLYGRLSDIDEQIRTYLPGIDLPREALGDNLALMLGTKTCLMEREDRVIWRFRLSGLNKPDSPLFKRFCAEALGVVVDVDSFARLCAVQTPPARSKYRGPLLRCRGTPDAAPSRDDEAIPADGSNTVTVAELPNTEESAPAEVAPTLLTFVHMLLKRTTGALTPAIASGEEGASSSPRAAPSAGSAKPGSDTESSER